MLHLQVNTLPSGLRRTHRHHPKDTLATRRRDIVEDVDVNPLNGAGFYPKQTVKDQQKAQSRGSALPIETASRINLRRLGWEFLHHLIPTRQPPSPTEDRVKSFDKRFKDSVSQSSGIT